MAEKKYVLFVVEGSTDKTALALIFERLFASDAVSFAVVRGDITTLRPEGDRPPDVQQRLIDLVNDFAERNHLEKGDIKRVVLIVDTDGAMVPRSAVLLDADVGLAYGLSEIRASNPEGIRERNGQKRRALDKLRKRGSITTSVGSTPFKVYYLSRNMEHALHGEAGNLSDARKVELARQFSRRYKNDLEGFKSLLTDEAIAIPGDYRETWVYISEGTHSLERGSNLHLVLE